MKGIRGLGRPEFLRIRVNQKEKDAFAKAAELSGLSISAWIRMALRQKATAELTTAGKETGL
jgi:antitoxin component of RelBE/YafQ-DinJ toxin-antitoxin module